MTTRLPPNYIIPTYTPLKTLIEAEGELSVLDGAKTITIGNVEALEFGEIGVDTDAQISLEYVAVEDEDFFIGAALRYEGDEGAFQIKAVEAGELATPFDLLDSDNFWQVIPPDTSSAAPLTLTITALAADDGVEKTGTLTIYDRSPTRTPLAVMTLSKTYVS